jgi:hypothetical protein
MTTRTIPQFKVLSTKQKRDQRSALCTEYKALREEIVKLFDVRTNLIHFCLLTFGAILSFGAASPTYFPILLLIYPLLASYFAFGWAHNHYRIGEIGHHIKDSIELKIDGLEWENTLRENTKNHFRSQEPFAKGVFLGTQSVSILLALILISSKIYEFYKTKTLGDHPTLLIIGGYVLIIGFGVLIGTLTVKAIKTRRDNLGFFSIKFSTPIVHTKDSEEIRKYLNNVSGLTGEIDDVTQKHPIDKIIINRPHVDIFSKVNEKELELSSFKSISASSFEIARTITDKEMAYFWYSTIWNAFHSNPNLNAVFYYPVDSDFGKTEKFKTANPDSLFDMIKLAKENPRTLVLGNYISDDGMHEDEENVKEKIDKKINQFCSEFWPIPKSIARLRTEFFCVTRPLFHDFLEYYCSLNWEEQIDDPTLLLVLWCFKEGHNIEHCDLGKYKDKTTRSLKVQKEQIDRAEAVIDKFFS